MTHIKHTLLLSATVLGLALGGAGLQAQPPENRGQGQGQHQAGNHKGGQGQGASQARPGRGQSGEPERSYRGNDERRRDGRLERRDVSYGPRIDQREIRHLLLERRDRIEIEQSRDRLPPGIRMNLERGKALPPGIGDRLDERILRDLPRYDGYEWRRVGPDVVLVEAANAIVHEILRDIFY